MTAMAPCLKVAADDGPPFAVNSVSLFQSSNKGFFPLTSLKMRVWDSISTARTVPEHLTGLGSRAQTVSARKEQQMIRSRRNVPREPDFFIGASVNGYAWLWNKGCNSKRGLLRGPVCPGAPGGCKAWARRSKLTKWPR